MDQDTNHRLTRVGPGTPMGQLLRRYWMPVAGASELLEQPVKPLRLLGEDLVLYRDLSGRHGLVDRACAHRRADLAFGFVEDHGIRCSYHGWSFDAAGRCVTRPFEDLGDPDGARRSRVRVKAYPVQQKAGLLWAYLGPDPAPLLPDWEIYSLPNGFVQIVISDVPCNWLQCQENSIDPVHFEWTHNNWSLRLEGRTGPYAPAHRELGFEEFEHGLIYRRLRGAATKGDPLWRIGRVCLWPNGFFLGEHFEWRVPVDDENTLSVCWFFTRVPREAEPYEQDRIPTWRGPVRDAQGRWITSHVINQDIAAWAGQGRIADRTHETLGHSDRGIVMLRQRLLADLVAVEEGRDPSGLVRDPARNHRIPLPAAEREFLLDGLPRDELLRHPVWRAHFEGFRFAYGQPAHVRDQFRRACRL